MGLRGPGAVVHKPRATAKSAKATGTPLWKKRGLSRVERVIAFVESLPVTSGPLAGKPMKVRAWQRKFLEAVYAVDATDRRPVRTAVCSVGRKNGKSSLSAALALAHLVGPESELRGEVYSAANDRFQASRLYHDMAAIIAKTPELKERISLRRHEKMMEVMHGDGEGSLFAALSAEVGTKDGLSPSFTVYDELGSAPNRALLDVLDTAMGGRDQPLMMVISTQAADDLAPMSELIDYGLRVQSGDVDDASFHLTLYTAPPEADPWALATWRLANPALGDFRSLEDVERQALQAQRMPSKAAAFKNKILNMRVASEVQFIPAEEWEACSEEPDADAEGEVYAGLDIGGTRDLTALVRVILGAEGTFEVLPMFWLPEDGIADREDKDRVPYRLWRDRGLLKLTPGKTLDPAYVAKEIAELHRVRPFKALAYDRWRIEDIRRHLAEYGVEDLNLVPHGQGFKDFTGACDALERAVADRLVRHGGNPILRWCVGNARVVFDPAGNRKLSKQRSSGRIDGAVALAQALNVAGIGPTEEAVPGWEDYLRSLGVAQ